MIDNFLLKKGKEDFLRVVSIYERYFKSLQSLTNVNLEIEQKFKKIKDGKEITVDDFFENYNKFWNSNKREVYFDGGGFIHSISLKDIREYYQKLSKWEATDNFTEDLKERLIMSLAYATYREDENIDRTNSNLLRYPQSGIGSALHWEDNHL